MRYIFWTCVLALAVGALVFWLVAVLIARLAGGRMEWE